MSSPFLVQVRVVVRPGSEEAFRAATLANVRQSRLEPGIFQFDLLEQQDAPGHFLLVEGYRTPEAVAAHKATSHYATWRDTVADMMAEPRTSTRWTACL
ncbi:MAG: putative quinol monooxygenase [Opitutaceae bacterium]